MGSMSISEKFENLKINENQDINILLLGETGVGKSTFINSIANYLHYKKFQNAEKNELRVLIPTSFTVTNQNFETVSIKIGFDDTNEHIETGVSATQDVKTYVFPVAEGRTRIRLIDTPGMGDTRGVEQDDINCDNILKYLSQFQQIHAICFLMKPTNSRITVLFEYCVKQILSRLEKSASRNIIFVFTNSRGSDYTGGETFPCLKKVIEKIKAQPPHVDIPFKENIFCFDNEAFRMLAALKNNVEYADDLKRVFMKSWDKSSEECWRLITYIIGDTSRDGLIPHQMHNTISVNEARRLVTHLSQPLADISQLISDNIRILDRHRDRLKIENQSLDQLKKKLHIPVITLVIQTKEKAIQEARRLMTEIDHRKKELEEERDVIVRSTAQFAHFLQNNAITPFNDAYKGYIEYLITREKSLGVRCDSEVIDNLEQLLYKYNEIKSAFDKSLEMNEKFGAGFGANLVTPKVVMESITKLYQLKHNGKKIKELLHTQKSSRSAEHNETCEYVHPVKTSFHYDSGKSDHEKKSKSKSKKNKSDSDNNKSKKNLNSKPDDKKKYYQNKSDSDNRSKKNFNSKPDDKKNYHQRVATGVFVNKGHHSYQGTSKKQFHAAFSSESPPPPYPGVTIKPKLKQDDSKMTMKVELSYPGSSHHASNEFSPTGAAGPQYQPYQPGPAHYQYPPPSQPNPGYYPYPSQAPPPTPPQPNVGYYGYPPQAPPPNPRYYGHPPQAPPPNPGYYGHPPQGPRPLLPPGYHGQQYGYQGRGAPYSGNRGRGRGISKRGAYRNRTWVQPGQWKKREESSDSESSSSQ